VTVTRGEEQITATLAGRREAKALGVAEGAPLLKLDRLMYDLDNNVVEWRVSLCHLDKACYEVELR
jgi:GntR family transcriptional regulator